MFSRIVIDKGFRDAYKKRKKAGESLIDVDEALIKVITGQQLPESYRDHVLSGNLKDVRCIHVRGDLLILYTPNANGKDLAIHALGTHHQLLKR